MAAERGTPARRHSPTTGGPTTPYAGPRGPLQLVRRHAGQPGRADRRPIGSVQAHGVPKVPTTDSLAQRVARYLARRTSRSSPCTKSGTTTRNPLASGTTPTSAWPLKPFASVSAPLALQRRSDPEFQSLISRVPPSI